MGIWQSFTAFVGGNYSYRAGPRDLGVGVRNMAMEQPGRAVDADFYSPRYNVRKTMELRVPTLPNPGAPLVPDYDLRANGVYLSGDMALTALLENERAENG